MEANVCFHCLAAHAAHTATHAACCQRANALRHRIAARHLTIVAWRRSPSSVRSAVSCAFRRIRWRARWSRFLWPRAERLSNASCTARKTRIFRSAQRHTERSARRALRRTRRAVAVPHRQRPNAAFEWYFRLLAEHALKRPKRWRAAAVRGRAFCFLPLPLPTGLPC